jgi:hypothetical protein
MRGFTAEAFNRLDLQSEGMELCTESIIKAAQAKLRIAEIPIVLHVDQRDRVPHLRSFRDGWRNLQVMMHFCSVWLFLAPGLLLALAGLLVTLAALSPPVGLLIYLAALCCTTLGVQVVLLAITTQSRVRGSKHARLRYARWFQLVSRWVRLEKGLLLGLAAAVGGVALFAWAAFRILRSDNPGGYISIQFDLFATKLALLGTTLFINGLQVFFTSLFLGLFGIRVADDEPERPPDARPRK